MSILPMLVVVGSLLLVVQSATLNDEEREMRRRAVLRDVLRDSDAGLENKREEIPIFPDVPDLQMNPMSLREEEDVEVAAFGNKRDKLPVFLESPDLSQTSIKRGPISSPGVQNRYFKAGLTGSKRVKLNKREPYEIKMCYFCDETCLMTLKKTKEEANEYLTEVTQGVQDRLQDLMGETTTVVRHGAMINFPTPAKSYLVFKSRGDQGNGLRLLANIANNFWKKWKPSSGTGGKTLYSYLEDNGCDVNVLLVSQYDNLWIAQNAGDVEGMATKMGICVGYGYSVVKLNLDIARMSTITAHEVGHLLGLDHDGDLSAIWNNHCSNNAEMTPCPRLRKQCTAENHACPDGQNECVMTPALSDESKFSKCSKAYWAGFRMLTQSIPDRYSLDCIKV